jgi:hypothetical protein
MKRMYWLIVILLLGACDVERELHIEGYREMIVVNSFLTPDSLITISLSKTIPYPKGDNNFPAVTDASALLFEDGILLGELQATEKEGAYRLDQYPKAGSTYALEVNVPGHPKITASTSIPSYTEVKACRQESQGVKQWRSTSTGVDIHFPVLPRESYFWLGLLTDNYLRLRVPYNPPIYRYEIDSTQVIRSEIGHYSFSNLLDKFNGWDDEGDIFFGNSRVNRSFDDVKDARIHMYYYHSSGRMVGDNMVWLRPEIEVYADIIQGSEEFDKYFKFMILDYMTKTDRFIDELPDPFAEKVVTYTNIKNGTGIFAGYNRQFIPFYNNPCK